MPISIINSASPNGTGQDILRLYGSVDTVNIPISDYSQADTGMLSVWMRLPLNVGESLNSTRTVNVTIALGSTAYIAKVGVQWKRFSFDIENPTARVITLRRATSSDVYVCNAQFELSKSLSDWKPAPEDMFKAVDTASENASNAINRVETNLNNLSAEVNETNEFRSSFYQYFALSTNNGIVMRALTDTGEQSHWYAQMRSDGFYIFNDQYVQPTGRFYRDRFEPSSIQMGKMKARPSARGGWIFTHER